MTEMNDIERKGRAAEKFTEGTIIKQGFRTFPTSCASSTADLIAMVDDKPIKIQVKAATSKDGRMKVDVRRSKAAGRSYREGDFDVLAVVNTETDKVAFLAYEDCDKASVTFRDEKPTNLNGLHAGYEVKVFSDYGELIDAIGKRSIAG